MQHGVLTPLGRQLRSVLIDLRKPVVRPRVHVSRYDFPKPEHGLRGYGSSPGSNSASAAVLRPLIEQGLDAGIRQPSHDAVETSSDGPRRMKRRTKRDHLGEVFRLLGKEDIAPRLRPVWKKDVSHWNMRDRGGRRAYKKHKERHRSDEQLGVSATTDLSVERILATYILETTMSTDPLRASWDLPHALTNHEKAYLSARGQNLDNVQTWSRILAERDTHSAASSLADLVHSASSDHVPIVLLNKLLRRPYVSAATLRMLLDVSWPMLRVRSNHSHIYTSDNTVFVTFLRLLRHARMVWPAAMESIAQLLITHLPPVRPGKSGQAARTRRVVTHMANAALRLITISTSEEPINNSAYQETAVIRVLQYMSEQEPQLQTTREGYKAVVRFQLVMKKTSQERQWAELKALSWPPWKQDRTAVDALITPKSGLTRAASTLEGMREAGYSPHVWERSAALLAGWDTDGTPTVQTRRMLGIAWDSGNDKQMDLWAARIIATRTAQEAWAAYLAYEENELTATESVHLAILEKLHAEEARQRMKLGVTQTLIRNERDPLLPGDSREVEPLPPSTHLYTYTSRPVPTIDNFIHQLQERSVTLRGHALAFAVTHASRLEHGMRYLRDTNEHSPEICNLLGPNPDTSIIRRLPDYLFTAIIQLLCRFHRVPLSRIQVHDEPGLALPASLAKARQGHIHRSTLALVLHLLHLRRTLCRPAWNAVFFALSRGVTHDAFHVPEFRDLYAARAQEPVTAKCYGVLIAYHLCQDALAMMNGVHVDLDASGFHSLCIIMENTVWHCSKVASCQYAALTSSDGRDALHHKVNTEAKDFLTSTTHLKRLKTRFDKLVGNNGFRPTPSLADQSSQTVPMLPRLLHAPSPALLHAYIRALGWAGDHEALLTTVKWMVEHEEELSTQRTRNRNADDMLRNCITALHVFLQRSWSPKSTSREALENADYESATNPAGGNTSEVLVHISKPASADLVDEVRRLVNSVEAWRGWATDAEIVEYCQDKRFQELLSISGRT
ncbi:hypothetical protein LTR62_002301 [Meristemomyces frigidus]|uniref:Uncharacterized protein n=1 Tax=Meristemomyces frigidus TaxID=1508187 RepID=A0AAN7TMI6_9PEZI|nr:hypothetical protein LTR62_002301 [Meristemomyces frigidus]